MQMGIGFLIELIIALLGVVIIYFYNGEAKLIGLAMFAVVEYLMFRNYYGIRRK